MAHAFMLVCKKMWSLQNTSVNAELHMLDTTVNLEVPLYSFLSVLLFTRRIFRYISVSIIINTPLFLNQHKTNNI